MESTINQKMLNHILAQIEENQTLPWNCGYIKHGFPRNYVSKRPYSGRNLLCLWCANYNRSEFLTFRQAQQMGGNIKKGEHGFPIIYAQSGGVIEDEEGNSVTKKGYAKAYYVFNISQTEGIKDLENNPEGDNPDVEKFIKSLPIEYVVGKNPSYNPRTKKINIPYASDFEDSSEYYTTIFHEIMHWLCGQKDEISEDEELTKEEKYSFEELVAELGSAILRCHFKIDTPKNINNSAAYIKSWLDVLKSRREMLFKAMKIAENAVDLILPKH